MTYIDYLNAFNQWLESNYLLGNAQLLFFRLLGVFNKAGWPDSVQIDTLRLMQMIDATSRNTADRAKDRLVESGWLRYERGKKGCPNRYWILDGSKENTVQNLHSIRNENGTETEQIRNGNGAHIKTKIKTENNTPLTPQPEETGFGPDLQAAFDSWLRYKRERRQPYKPEGLKKLISRIRNNAEKYGESAVVELIEDCMASNWQGIIFDRLSKTKGAVPKSSRDTIKTDADYESGDSFI